MTDKTPRNEERRALTRRLARAEATLYRDSDLMRNGIDGVLRDISPIGIGLLLSAQVDLDEQVEVHLVNRVQRIEKTIRGTVKHVNDQGDSTWLIGVELRTRLSPVEISMLRLPQTEDGSVSPGN